MPVYACHPEQAGFAQRRIWASRAKRRVSERRYNTRGLLASADRKPAPCRLLKRLCLIVLLCVTPAGFCAGAAAQSTDWQQIAIPALPAFSPKEPKRSEFPNGMIVFLHEDHDLRFIDVVGWIGVGSPNKPADKGVRIAMYGEGCGTGGTKTQTGDELDDYLEE